MKDFLEPIESDLPLAPSRPIRKYPLSTPFNKYQESIFRDNRGLLKGVPGGFENIEPKRVELGVTTRIFKKFSSKVLRN